MTEIQTVALPVLKPGERLEIAAHDDDSPDGPWFEWVLWGKTDVFKGLGGTMDIVVSALTAAIKQDRADAGE